MSSPKVQAAAESLAAEQIFLSTRERKIMEATLAVTGGSKKKPKPAKKSKSKRRR